MAFLAVKDQIRDRADAQGYDAALLAAQVAQESAFDPEATSKAGARGLMQFMPQTWAWAVTMGWIPQGVPATDPRWSLQAGVSFMRWLLARYKGHASPMELALAAYNAGPGTVDKAVKATGRSDWEGVKAALPSESRDYVPKILGRLPYYRAIYGAAKVAIPGLAVGFGVFLIVFLLRRFS